MGDGMDLNKLYYFYIVAKNEHVTKAAEELHISQPALTKAVKLLEDEMGIPLFRKEKRNIKLTVFGKFLKNKLEDVFKTINDIPAEIDRMRGEAKNTIRINMLAASGVVTEAIVEYKKMNEKVIFQVIQNEEEHDCDISITTNSVNFSGVQSFEKQHNITEEIYLAVPEGLQCETNVLLKEFANMDFVNLAGSRLFRLICDKFCEAVGFTPKIIFESDSIIAVKNIIGAGAGIGFWPEFSWGEASGDIKLLSIEKPQCYREIVIGLHDNATLSDFAEDFYSYLIDFMEQKKTCN